MTILRRKLQDHEGRRNDRDQRRVHVSNARSSNLLKKYCRSKMGDFLDNVKVETKNQEPLNSLDWRQVMKNDFKEEKMKHAPWQMRFALCWVDNVFHFHLNRRRSQALSNLYLEKSIEWMNLSVLEKQLRIHSQEDLPRVLREDNFWLWSSIALNTEIVCQGCKGPFCRRTQCNRFYRKSEFSRNSVVLS